MPTYKVIKEARSFTMEAGPDIGILLQILYLFVKPEDAGHDLFDEDRLARFKKTFIPQAENRFTFTVEKFPTGAYWRVFAEPKK